MARTDHHGIDRHHPGTAYVQRHTTRGERHRTKLALRKGIEPIPTPRDRAYPFKCECCARLK